MSDLFDLVSISDFSKFYMTQKFDAPFAAWSENRKFRFRNLDSIKNWFCKRKFNFAIPDIRNVSFKEKLIKNELRKGYEQTEIIFFAEKRIFLDS